MATDAKRTKRVRDASEELDLEEHIARKRAALLAERQEAPSLYAHAKEIRARADGLTNRWQYRMASDLRDQAEQLEAEARIRESMEREHHFESTVVTYLRTYHQKLDAAHDATHATHKRDAIAAYHRHSDLSGQRRAAILDEYLTGWNQAPPRVAMCARDVCPRCSCSGSGIEKETKLLLCAAKSIMSCPTCGYTVAYLDATSTSTSFDEEVQYSQYSYKRINHWSMWLTLVQGKEAHRVPDEIMQQVMHELYYTHRITNPKDVTQQRVREILRKLRLRKAYDHVAQVTARISGVRALRISPEVEAKLKNMFLQMQPAWSRHAPKSRTNFLSYSYVLYRCFQIMGLHHMLDSVALLKGRDKLISNDAVFRRMSEELGWPVFELPPPS